MTAPFTNTRLLDFARDENVRAMRAAIAQVEGAFDAEYPVVINGEEIRTGKYIASLNPCNPREVAGRVCSADAALADRAVRAAADAFRSWSRTPAERRAEILFRAAERMRERRHLLNALMVVEVGKNWLEADADTAEAIDFLEYYGREMLRWAQPGRVTPVPGERNELFYIPLGVGVVISPWNFPCAILTGMTSASLVTGNPTILKPASAAPVIAYHVYRILIEAGVPENVLHFVPGSGSDIGDALVEHPLVRFVSFTGSRDVGCRIYERAAKVQPGQRWLKRVVAEMGGKDAIIVDETADLDSAAEGVVISAFGYQGQKCSACSRLIVLDAVHDDLLDRVLARTERIRIGDVRDPSNWMGPVIDAAQERKVLSYIEIGRKEGRLRTGGSKVDGLPGYFILPTIFDDVAPRARIAQEEIFGPVLAVLRAKDFDEALAIANDTDYGLTGSIYSRDEARIARAREEFHAGNLYANRKCTGALVGGHPFGGFNMSGTDSKAGGPDYLPLFLQAKSFSRAIG
jgi:1-pyrroline-5-carboxylate dehydrogenase